MKKPVQEFIQAKNNLTNYFGIQEDFYIKPATSYNWYIRELEGTYFVGYSKEGEKTSEAVIVRQNGEPYIVEKGDYTLVVCIECVKIALVLKNTNKQQIS